jgi:hypothetical protein
MYIFNNQINNILLFPMTSLFIHYFFTPIPIAIGTPKGGFESWSLAHI